MSMIKPVARMTTTRTIDTELSRAPKGSTKARLLTQAKALGLTLTEFENLVYDAVEALTDADPVVGV
ncbi:hypothetical protein I9018_13910 [Pseudomonas sp. MPFS]|uniref:hypothetical protein n=1 Tax=Pseudomonas sp. MPFS TaxID=2795724 RepID=UPI001F134294|nr:hypothetical protein [Pseudomonas sp. MPFS]UMZ14719.1 hypothetical protein I9018_13910 [Pseudomonas sp. MPFS]